VSTSPTLGRLEQVDLRKVWQNEAGQFTPWLAQVDNIALLADTLGLELEVEAQEKGVGPFRADFVCRDTSDGTLVLIENQLERTDHTHLGQLMTYAAGLDAVTIVWIAERFTDEHRAALDWLNEITGEKVGFFGLEVELWRIGNSPVAPKFNIVSRPNDWTKFGPGPAGGGMSDTRQLQLEYWRAFANLLVERKSKIKPTQPMPRHYMTVRIGRPNVHLAALIDTMKRQIAVELYFACPDAKKHYKQLEADKDAIEAAIGGKLDWRELPAKKASRILLLRENSPIDERALWPAQHEWLWKSLENFDEVFRPRVKALPASYEEAGDDEELDT
jgi:hypothetical protein